MNSQQRVILAERPRYIVPTANCFRVVSGPVAEPGPGEVRICSACLSMHAGRHSRIRQLSIDSAPRALATAGHGRLRAARKRDFGCQKPTHGERVQVPLALRPRHLDRRRPPSTMSSWAATAASA